MKEFNIQAGYHPGLIIRIAQLHAGYDAEHWCLSSSLEVQVSLELADLVENYNSIRDCIWSLHSGDSLGGSISIQGTSNPPDAARLRVFTVSNRLRGQGLRRGWVSSCIFQ